MMAKGPPLPRHSADWHTCLQLADSPLLTQFAFVPACLSPNYTDHMATFNSWNVFLASLCVPPKQDCFRWCRFSEYCSAIVFSGHHSKRTSMFSLGKVLICDALPGNAWVQQGSGSNTRTLRSVQIKMFCIQGVRCHLPRSSFVWIRKDE